MNWDEYIEQHQCDYDFGSDTMDLMKQAYVAGLESALAVLLRSEDGDYDFILWQLKNLIKESE